MSLRITKKQFFVWGILAGFLISSIHFLFMLKGMNVIRTFTGERFFGFDNQREVYKVFYHIFSYAPWFVILILFIWGVIKRNISLSLSFGTGYLLFYMAVLSFIFFGPVVHDYATRRPFDAALWKAPSSVHGESNDPVKTRMVDDLLNRKILIGMSKEEVISLLGQPTQENYLSFDDFMYCLGQQRRGVLRLDSELLVISFIKDKAVATKLIP